MSLSLPIFMHSFFRRDFLCNYWGHGGKVDHAQVTAKSSIYHAMQLKFHNSRGEHFSVEEILLKENIK